MKKVFVSSLLLGSLGLLCAQTPVPGRYLVGFRDGSSASQAAAVMRGMGARQNAQIPDLNIQVVDLPESASPTAFFNRLKERFDVEFIEQDMYLTPDQTTPNDPNFGSQWALTRIQAPQAWNTTKGSTAIIVAILDSGVDPTHSDLQQRLVNGWNTFSGNNDSRDVQGHGTKVAGAAVASTNNGVGIAGVSWNSLIMPIRVTDTNGYATYTTIANALNWAANNGARVANISFDIIGSSAVSNAAQFFQSRGGVVFSSAGNSGTMSSLAPSPYITTVSATDPNDMLYSWSTTGPRVTLSAPGCVYTSFNGNSYGGACGTSFAAPTAAGVAALVLAANPNLTPAQVTQILLSTSDDLGPAGLDPQYGHGRVNAARAVAAAVNNTTAPAPAPAPTPDPTPADTAAPVISITAPSNGATVSGNVAITFNTSDNIAVTRVELLVNGNVVATSTTAPFTVRWQTNRLARGTYILQGRARDAAGNAGLSQLVTVYR